MSDEEQSAEVDDPVAAAALAALPPLDVGMYFDVPHERYHADPCPEPSLSASTAKRIVQECALEGWYYHPRLGKGQEDGSAASRSGSLIDTLLMGYGPTIVVVPYDGYQSKDAKRMRDEAVALGKMPIIEKKFDAAMVAVDAVKKRLLETRGFAFDGKSQVTMIWRQGSIWCRGRIDHLKTLVMYDLKWYESSSPRAVKRACGEYGIEIQAVAYEEAMGTLYPERKGEFRYQPIFIQNKPPYAINMSPLHETMLELGKLRWKRAKRVWAASMKSGVWPDHGDRTPVEATKFQIEDEMLAGMGPAPKDGDESIPF